MPDDKITVDEIGLGKGWPKTQQEADACRASLEAKLRRDQEVERRRLIRELTRWLLGHHRHGSETCILKIKACLKELEKP